MAVLYWFQELRCERSPCRFNSDRPPCEPLRWQVPLGRELDCLSSCCGFDSRCHRFEITAFDYWLGRLLLRQQEGDRNSYAVLCLAKSWRGRFCLHNRLVFIQESAGSIPAHVTALVCVMEVTRPDEDTVLKTAAGQTVVGSSPTASAFRRSLRERFHTEDCISSAITCVVVGERCDSLRSHFG